MIEGDYEESGGNPSDEGESDSGEDNTGDYRFEHALY